MEEKWKEELDIFLDERCYEVDNFDARETMKRIHPDYEGTWGVRKNSLKDFISNLIQNNYKELLEETDKAFNYDRRIHPSYQKHQSDIFHYITKLISSKIKQS